MQKSERGFKMDIKSFLSCVSESFIWPNPPRTENTVTTSSGELVCGLFLRYTQLSSGERAA